MVILCVPRRTWPRQK